ncbi:MAG: hypothetical protein ACI8UD_000457 [Planctomycetota bacterium]|jgi:hypothetical protein
MIAPNVVPCERLLERDTNLLLGAHGVNAIALDCLRRSLGDGTDPVASRDFGCFTGRMIACCRSGY